MHNNGKRLTVNVVMLLLMTQLLSAQGKVVINEFLPWPGNACSVTSEFVELFNFGPGPVNIGCYIVTDGDYSITIPPNTILLPGHFYVMAGTNTIAAGCANISSSVTADLNWNTCNCTSAPIPTTGDGLFTDGGSASEQVVLLDPALKVVDAVVRTLPAEPASAITTAVTGGCSAHTFDLDTMTINYETIGQSAGRGNSFARILDGDCGWEKDTQQSGGATNNTNGGTVSITSSLSIIQAIGCINITGSIAVSYSNILNVFPVSYILARDDNNNHIFDVTDTYLYGVDSLAPAVNITGLASGRYSLTLTPATGCNNQSYTFVILDCTILLASHFLQLHGLKHEEGNVLYWTFSNCTAVKNFVVERSYDGIHFETAGSVVVHAQQASQQFSWEDRNAHTRTVFYRIQANGYSESVYSGIITLNGDVKALSLLNAFPNPAQKDFTLMVMADKTRPLQLVARGVQGRIVHIQTLQVMPGINQLHPAIAALPKGLYYISLADATTGQYLAHTSMIKE